MSLSRQSIALVLTTKNNQTQQYIHQKHKRETEKTALANKTIYVLIEPRGETVKHNIKVDTRELYQALYSDFVTSSLCIKLCDWLNTHKSQT